MTGRVPGPGPDPVPDFGPDPDPDGSGTDPGSREWLSVAEAARRLGVSEKAIRNRIRRGTMEWRPAGNHGREVLVLPDMEPEDGTDPGTVELRVRVARLEERLAVVERERDLYRGLAERERDGSRDREARMEAAFRDREAKLEAALAEARRPWLAKVIAAVRKSPP